MKNKNCKNMIPDLSVEQLLSAESHSVAEGACSYGAACKRAEKRVRGGCMHRIMLFFVVVALALLPGISWCATKAAHAQREDRERMLKAAYRFERNHWIYVHLEGSPREIGYQHGWLLAPEITDALEAVKIEDTHATKRGWPFFRMSAQYMLWPRIEAEYREELQGIVDGAQAHGERLDLWDIVALNAMEELPDYYVPWFNRKHQQKHPPRLRAPGNCSAFVVTGAWTKDHQPVIAHNNWTSYLVGERWRIIFDIVPLKGQRILMDGIAGSIASGDDYGINGAQLAVTETTITGYASYDPSQTPEFVRARKALQYATSIDEYERIFLDHNNGGYANDWLLADYKTGEIARLEVGLKMHKLWRTMDGYYAGANYPSDPEFIKAETDFDPTNLASSPNARRVRWEELMESSKGALDAGLAQKLMADHTDSYAHKEEANERTLCGHLQNSPRGVPEWEWAAYYPGGAVNAKAADAEMVKSFAFTARSGMPCGESFDAEKFLSAHPEFNWQKSKLRTMEGNPWAEFTAGDHEK